MKTKPRILIVITKADVGGAQMHVLQIMRELRSRYNFILATGSHDFLTARASEIGVQVELVPHLVRSISPIRDVLALAALCRLIRRLNPELVHAHSFKAGGLARVAARLAGSPCLYTAHGWAFTPGAPAPQRLFGIVCEWILCRICAGIVTICRHDEKLAAKWRIGSSTTRHLIPNAGDEIAVVAGQDSGRFILLTVGRLTPTKNQALLLRMLREVPPEVSLQIIGDGAEKAALETLASELGVSSRVQLSGAVREKSLAMSNASAFVLSSRFEGLPLSILEAMSAGLPVVSTDVGGINEAVIHGETGFLVQPGDYKTMGRRINELLTQPALRKKMGERGRQHYLDCFTVSRFTTQMQTLYQSLIPDNSTN